MVKQRILALIGVMIISLLVLNYSKSRSLSAQSIGPTISSFPSITIPPQVLTGLFSITLSPAVSISPPTSITTPAASTSGTVNTNKGCQQALGNITRKVNDFTIKKQTYISVFQTLVTNFTQVEQILKSMGLNTSGLQGAIQQLQTKITAFTNDVNALINQLQSASGIVCKAGGLGKFVSTTRSLQNKVRQDILDIKQIYNKQIRPSLGKLKDLQGILSQITPSTPSGTLSATPSAQPSISITTPISGTPPQISVTPGVSITPVTTPIANPT